MAEFLNLKLKDKVEPSTLQKYGFLPKYDEDTGKVKEYIKKFHIGDETHFTFVFYPMHITDNNLFRRFFCYEAWMSGFDWGHICDKEALKLLYDLIVDGIVEVADTRTQKER